MRGVIFPLRRVISPAISVGHFEGRPDGTESALASRLKPVVASLRGLWALGTRSDEGAVLVVYGRTALSAGAEHYHQYQFRRGR